MIEKHIKLDFNRSDTVYTQYLIELLENGIYSDLKETWVDNISFQARTSLGHLQTIVDWVNEENSFGCSIVWNRFEKDPNQDFGKSYYENSKEFIDFQIAKGNFYFI